MTRIGFGTIGVMVAATAVIAGCFNSPRTSPAEGRPLKTQLNVAIFAYLPDANAAIERFEGAFEATHPTIDLDLELWDPYRDDVASDGLEQIQKFDVVEIDTCRLDEMVANPTFALDELPDAWRLDAARYIEPARTLAGTSAAKYVAAHWVCGNFVTFWSDNTEMAGVKTFDDLVAALNPTADRPLLIDLSGKTGLGDFYADALLDLYGAVAAKSQLQALADLPAGQAVTLDDKAKERILKLASACAPKYRTNLQYFGDHSYVYPRDFAGKRGAVLVGYSERLYYTERELQLTPKNSPPCIKDTGITVRPMVFSDRSAGTPTWIDGFVIPRGKLSSKRAEIKAFLEFAQSSEGYAAFIEPTPYLPASYLLPAVASAYAGEAAAKQPCLGLYRAHLDATFPVVESKTWRGMRRAGAELEALLAK